MLFLEIFIRLSFLLNAFAHYLVSPFSVEIVIIVVMSTSYDLIILTIAYNKNNKPYILI
jgi:hypothetical protein